MLNKIISEQKTLIQQDNISNNNNTIVNEKEKNHIEIGKTKISIENNNINIETNNLTEKISLKELSKYLIIKTTISTLQLLVKKTNYSIFNFFLYKTMFKSLPAIILDQTNQSISNRRSLAANILRKYLLYQCNKYINIYQNNKNHKCDDEINNYDYMRLQETIYNIHFNNKNYEKALENINKIYLLNSYLDESWLASLDFDHNIIKYHLCKTNEDYEIIANFFLENYKNSNSLFSLINAGKIVFSHDLFDNKVKNFIIKEINNCTHIDNYLFFFENMKLDTTNKHTTKETFKGLNIGFNILSPNDYEDVKTIFNRITLLPKISTHNSLIFLYKFILEKDLLLFKYNKNKLLCNYLADNKTTLHKILASSK